LLSATNKGLTSLPRDEQLIEFHIHSKGHGHWAGAIVTIEALSKLGYKFRLFSGRDPPIQPVPYNPQMLELLLQGHQPPMMEPIQRDLLNYIHVPQATMQQPFLWRIYISLRAMVRNTSYSRPMLIITDGDAPGLMQGWWHGIPTLALAHGNIFVQPPPAWVESNPLLAQAWKVEHRKNYLYSMWANYKVGFNHVPLPNTLRIGAREAVQEIAQIRTHQIASLEQGPPPIIEHRRIVSSYFRDKNGGMIVHALLEEGIDVVVFGELDVPPSQGEGRLTRVENAAYFVPFMGIVDGIIGSAGCNLAAECYYAQIPMLMLHSDWDTEHILNAAMVQRTNTYRDGSRAMFSCAFTDFSVDGMLHQEVQLFIERVKASKASEAFYERNKHNQTATYAAVEYKNQLLEGSSDQMTEVLRILEELKA
jgi:UDP-N-acetylglucosamine--N-acetylmuramyl-(pentapeptide) pyrophosphoryl-undecaprenol N-acetylglucosamine transferase